MKTYLLCILFLFSFFSNQAQDLAKSRKASFYTYIFKLNEKEVEKIYRENLKIIKDSYFHTVVDSFETYHEYKKQLPYGHYLYAYAEEDQLVYELKPVEKLQIKILNNKNDLAIHLHDSLGNSVSNAAVYVKNKKIHFDEATKCYRLKNTSHRGILVVKYQNLTTYHLIEAKYKAKGFEKTIKRIFFGRPLSYITFLFRDPIYSIKYHYPQGYIRKVKNLFDSDWWYRHTDKDEIIERKDEKFNQNHRGFIIFNKPIYRLQDTVKFKANILTRKGKPVKKPIQVVLNNYSERIEYTLTTLKPYRNGAYEYSFLLHDSLKLKLGSNYDIILKNKKSKTYIKDDFKYEDYELKSNTFTLRNDKKEYFKGEKIILYAKAIDENELNVLDSKVRLTVIPGKVSEFSNKQVFVSDTLWEYEQTLDAIGETKITLPDSIFPNAKMGIDIHAIFLNSSNEQHKKDLNFTIHYQPVELRLSLKGDSLTADLFVSSVSQKTKGELAAYSDDKTEIFRKEVSIPYKELANPYIKYYKILVKKSGTNYKYLTENLNMREENPGIKVFTNRTTDSVWVRISNERNIPFWYTFYRKNQRLKSGFAQSDFTLNHRATLSQNYFISIQYVWNNQVTEEEYAITLPQKQLQIETDQPITVSPGQTIPIKITVKDIFGKPVKNADLTAYAITKKFPNRQNTETIDFSKRYKSRKLINQFKLKYKFENEEKAKTKLYWDRWNKEMGLDSITYYRFLYPEKGIYISKKNLNPSERTQLSPFIVKNGRIDPIQMLFVDEEPVYFQLSGSDQRYSFQADSGYHTLKIRTNNQLIKVDSVRLVSNYKTIISINPDVKNRYVKVYPVSTLLSATELQVLNKYLMPISNYYPATFKYVKQNNRIFLLNGTNKFVGPVKPNYTNFIKKGDYQLNFMFEPGYEYEFFPQLLKMRTWNSFKKYNASNYITRIEPDFNETEFTEKEIDSLYAFAKESTPLYLRSDYDANYKTEKGYGKVNLFEINYPENQPKNIKHILVFKENEPDFIKIHAGSDKEINQLSPGNYSFMFMLYFNEYFYVKNVEVKKMGSIICRLILTVLFILITKAIAWTA